MKDARLKLLSVFLLSVSAYASVTGAALAFIWWLIFSKRLKSLPSLKIFLGLFMITGAISLLMEYRGLPGISYFIRMSTIILIAGYAYTELSSKDMLNVMTWLLGERYGFELGLISAIAVQKIRQLSTDYARAKVAHRMKAVYRGGKDRLRCADYLSIAGIILINSLKDSKEQSKVLAIRGYRHGGRLQPVFDKSKYDYIPIFCATGLFLCTFLTLVTYL